MTDLFVTPAMTAVTQAVFALEIASLFVMLIVLWAANRARKTQRKFLASLRPDLSEGSVAKRELRHFFTTESVLQWMYVAGTLVIAGVTTYLYLYQPHLL